MCWKGPPKKQNKPEQRNFSLVVKNSNDNMYLRTHGLSCLMNHEIGTHYVSMTSHLLRNSVMTCKN